MSFGSKRTSSVQHCKNKSCHENAIEHLIVASNSASSGQHDQADYHLDSALSWADMHHKKLQAAGMHDKANEYVKGISDHVNRIKRSRTVKKAGDCQEDHAKLKKQCKCGYMIKMVKSEDLTKGFLPPTKAAPSFQNVTDQKKMKVGGPRKDTRYNYKPAHELHPHDVTMAHEKFGGKDIGRYDYPVDKETGRLVHGTRVPSQKTPQALGSVKDTPEHHRPGATVRIQGHQGHEGKLGIVRTSHPDYSGKIAVQIGPSEHHKVYVDPHQVRLSKPKDKMEKALVTVHNIRKAFMKSESVEKAESPKMESMRQKTKGSKHSFEDHKADHGEKIVRGAKIGSPHYDVHTSLSTAENVRHTNPTSHKTHKDMAISTARQHNVPAHEVEAIHHYVKRRQASQHGQYKKDKDKY